MKIHILVLAMVACALLGGAAKAQTLNWGSLAYSDLVDSKGDSLDNSFVFELGAFDPIFTPETSNIDDWFANWRVFDTATYNAGNGVFTGTAQIQDVPGYASLFEGLEAYVWVRNGTSPGPDTEWFLARKSVDPESWVFPSIDPGCCPNGEVTQWSVSDLGNENPVWGNQGGHLGGGDYEVTGPYDIQTHVVPEPSALLFGVLGVVSTLHRRRRVET